MIYEGTSKKRFERTWQSKQMDDVAVALNSERVSTIELGAKEAKKAN
jgi:hypothetical protein